MKTLKQLREQVQINEVADEERKLNTLVRAGLYDPKKIPMLKRALDKDNDKTSPTERKMLLDLLDKLLSQVVANRSVYTKVKQNLQSKDTVSEEKDFANVKIPAVLILKRKSIRQFPDGTVALYYSDALKKFVSIPFTEIGISDITEETKTFNDIKENTIEFLKNINESENIKFEDGTVLLVTSNMAKKVLGVYESLNKQNKQQMVNILSEDKNSFLKIVNFALNK